MNIRPWREWQPVLGSRVYVDPAATVIGRVTIGWASRMVPAGWE